MAKQMSKPNKGRNKIEPLIRKANDEGLQGNTNQNTEPSVSGFLTSNLMKGTSSKKLLSEMTLKNIDAGEAARLKGEQEKEERRERKQDMTELQAMWENKLQLMKEFNEAKILQAKWARYMKCDGSPDPVNQREINTYIGLRLEDKSREDAENVLNDSKLDLKLIEEINFLLLDSSLEVLPEEKRSVYQKTIDELQDLIIYKLDMATLHVLHEATVMANKETGNLQHAVMTNDISLCCWGNIMKNPRIRSFEFLEINYAFDIPRIIALTDCAIRVLITKFDHYSPTSKSIIPRMKKIEEPEEVIKEQEVQEKDEANKEETAENEEEKADFKLSKPAFSFNYLETEGEPTEEVQEEVVEDFENPPTPEPTEWEDFDEDEGVVDLRAFSVLGNIYQFNLLQLPPQPRFVGSWTISQLVDPPEIIHLEYVNDSASHYDGGKDMKKDEKHLIAVSLVLPSDVLCLAQPHIAHWDYERKMWNTHRFSDVTYNEETKTVAFKTSHFGTFCLLQNAHINMPFQFWEIRPHTLNSAVLTISSSFITIQIEIKDEYCCLSSKKIRPELKSITDIWVTPAELIVMMKKAGVNIFPSEDSVKFVSVLNKHPLVEERLYQQMALTASAISYSWSTWNAKLSDSYDILFQGAEALEDDAVLEDSWSIFMATKYKVLKLQLIETEEQMEDLKEEEVSFNNSEEEPQTIRVSTKLSKTAHMMRTPSQRPSTTRRIKTKGTDSKSPKEQFAELFNLEKSQFKSNIYHLMPTFASENAVTRVNNTSFQFICCVHKLLTATRVHTYS